MPIYEYVCADCGAKFEAIRSFKEADSPIPCEDCESRNTTRQLSLFFARSGGQAVAGSKSGCSNCSGGSCAGCNN